MAEQLEAVLSLRIDSFATALQQAASQVQAFAQSVTGAFGAASQVFQQQVQQVHRVAEATRQSSAVIRQTKKDEAAVLAADMKAQADLYRSAEEQKQLIFRQTLQREVAESKRRASEEATELKSRSNLYRQMEEEKQRIFRQTLQREVEENKRREQAEKEMAARILATREASARDLEALEDQRRARADLRFRASNAASNASANAGLNPLGQGQGGLIAARELFLLQAHINAIKEASKETTLFEGAMLRIGSSLRTVASLAASGALIAIPFAIAAWGKEAAQTAMQMESLRATFNAIAGSASAGARSLGFLRDIAQKIGLDFLTTAQSFKGLDAAARGTQLEGNKVKVLFEQLAGGMRVLGLTSDQAKHGLVAIEQMLSKNKITAEELRGQLSESIPGSVSIMARALGVGTDELNKMMKAGDLLAEDVLPRFGAQVAKELGPGLAEATQTAVATFARFGNNVRDVSVAVGESILTILKPVIDTINKGFELYQRAQKQADEQRNAGVGAAPQQLESITGAPDLNKHVDSMRRALAMEQEVLRVLNETSKESVLWTIREKQTGQTREQIIADQEDVVKRYAAAWKRVMEERQTFLDAQADTGMLGGQGDTPFAKQTKAIRTEVEALSTSLKSLDAQRKLFPSMFAADGAIGKAREELRQYDQAIKKISETIASSKQLQQNILPEVAEEAKRLDVQRAAAQQRLDMLEATDKAAKDAAREKTRLEKEAFRDAETMARQRIDLEDKFRVEIAKFEDNTAGKIRETLTQTLSDAKRLYTDQTLTAKYESVKRMEAAQEEGRSIIDEHDRESAELRAIDEERMGFEQAIIELTAKGTQSRLDDFLAKLAKQRAALQEAIDYGRQAESLMEDFNAAGVAAADRIQQEEQEKALKEAAKQWREFANTIEGTLASAFNSILSGSKNLFEGIRTAFLSLLAKLAADALTHAIIIPAIVQFIGGGGAGSAGASTGSLFSGAGLAGSGGSGAGSGSGSDMLGMATGIAGAGAQGYQLMTGGSLFGAGSFGAGLMATELGFLPGIGPALGGVGGGGMVGPPATALGATTIGTVIGGIGAGIAVGMMLKQINTMMGIKGTAGSALAGAGGGALAGSIILPGIGTAIGAVVGAIGGALAGLLSKPAKQPGFDIESLQPGQVEYDSSLGLRIRQNFKILDDFHQKLGTDYEDFIGAMDNSINELFQQVVSQVSNASPEVQRALVEPLNAAFSEVAALIAQYPKIGGEDFKKQLEVMMQDFAGIFENSTTGAIHDLMEAVEKIDPIVKAFTKIIDSLLEDIRELGRQQQALHTALEGNIQTLRESLMSPAQLLLARKNEYMTLIGQFEGGDEATRIALAPRIGELSTAILELSKTVFAQSYGDLTGIQAGIKTLQESLYTPQQSLGARQNELVRLLEEFRGGNQSVRTVLAPQITQLALQIMELSKGVTNLAEQESKLAEQQAHAAQRQQLMADFPQQIRTLTEALYSPAQQYLSGRQQLTELMAQFRSSTPEQQMMLEPTIAQLTAEILNLAQGVDVLGQDPQLLRQTQSELLGVMREVQNTIAAQTHNDVSETARLQGAIDQTRLTIESTQAQMVGVLREVEFVMAGTIAHAGVQTIQALWATAGAITGVTYTMSNGMIFAEYQTANGMIAAQYDASGRLMTTEHYIGGVLQGSINNTTNTVGGWSQALYQQQDHLIGVVASVRDTAWFSYTQLINVLWTEVGLAHHEIAILANSLYHLETVDAVVARSLGVLGEMNARLGNPLNVNMGESLMTQLQRNAIDVAQRTLNMQGAANRTIIGLLAKPAFGLSWEQGMQLGRDVVGFQHGGLVPKDMLAWVHGGERVIPEWDNRGSGGGGRSISIAVYGGTKDPGQIADIVIQRIEQKSGRLHTSTIQTSRR